MSLPYNFKVPSLILSSSYCLCGFSCVIPVFAWVSARISGFLPLSKTMQISILACLNDPQLCICVPCDGLPTTLCKVLLEDRIRRIESRFITSRITQLLKTNECGFSFDHLYMIVLCHVCVCAFVNLGLSG